MCVCATSASGYLQLLENQILVGCIDFGTHFYVLVCAQSLCQVCLLRLLALFLFKKNRHFLEPLFNVQLFSESFSFLLSPSDDIMKSSTQVRCL